MSTAPRRVPLDAILRRSAWAESRTHVWRSGPVDRSKWFVCPTLTPLYYAPFYRDLGEGHQRRYNQLTGLCFNELIAFFEESFAGSVLAALADARQRVDGLLAECLESFLHEERRHIGYWRELNRRSEPDLYRDRMNAVLEFPATMRRLLRVLTDHPTRFPVVFWVMLALEERSLDISRRCLRLDPAAIEPHYRDVYRHHLRDEARHVQLDRYLIERFYEPLPIRWRRLNARLLATLIGRFFLPPTRSAVRVVRRLTVEHPELAPLLPEMIRQLGRVGDDPDYQDMMYSRATTPMTFTLFDRFEELQGMSRVLTSYRPDITAERDRRNA